MMASIRSGFRRDWQERQQNIWDLAMSQEPARGTEFVVVLRRGELPEGQTKKFWLQCGGREVEGFVVHQGGEHHAFVNQCRHVPMTMDWIENRFLTEDKCFIQCATHGALFEPKTGLCVDGPPAGKSLLRIPIEWRGDELIARCPEAQS